MAANPANFNTSTGRLANDPVDYPRNDGSVVRLITLAIPRNYTNRKNEVETDFVQYSLYIPKDRVGKPNPWDNVHRGDLIQLGFTVKRAPYTDNEGNQAYPKQELAVEGFPNYLESKEVTEARLKRRQEQEQGQAQNQSQAQTAQPQNTPADNTAGQAAAQPGPEDEIARIERELAEAKQAQSAQNQGQPAGGNSGHYDASTPFS